MFSSGPLALEQRGLAGLLQPTSHFELPRSRFVQRPRDQVRSVAVAEFVRERKSLLEELDDFAALVC
jgi:hypothetical protein